MNPPELPTRAAAETLLRYGITPDRCVILQNSSTLVLRMTETVVARIVQDVNGPRKGTAWFTRENAIAQPLTALRAPVIPLHPDLPPGPHEHLGYPMNFWRFVERVDDEPNPAEIGTKLFECHHALRSFDIPLQRLGILSESMEILLERELFPSQTQRMLKELLEGSLEALTPLPHQALHGDAHLGNLINTKGGLLWTDWEDAFEGPVEWDMASAIWNAKLLDNDLYAAEEILTSYRQAGGHIDEEALEQCLVARAAVITAWYPILYPHPNAERRSKLQRRIEWLEAKYRS